MSSEYITSQPQKTGTVYRFIRVPELNQNSNTVVLIKNPTTTESSTITRVQKQVEQVTAPKLITTTTESTGGKKRDDYRRFQHNQIERARREKINNWIMELGKIIDDNSDNSDDNTSTNNNQSNKNGEALSKGGILEKACEYISHLKSVIKSQQPSSSIDELNNEIKRLTDENELLKFENTMLKRKYHMEGIGDDEDDCMIKRPKSESDDFKLGIEFDDTLPCDEIST
ncbi:CLUMA_CG018694, isoform A [Clunio marinus]|uniref:CLUMA_CG018694, isoform A n=1 Tax=Clunio marinus TaxID=568069 RepID=A0A1J1J149_9DIPT|nr:CLUMA_CG018694, isoform A [Clunio marinus]